MIEYALMAGIVSIAALAALQALGPGLLALYQMVAAAVQAAV
jgi:Flp pilus assembly pilin Flp